MQQAFHGVAVELKDRSKHHWKEATNWTLQGEVLSIQVEEKDTGGKTTIAMLPWELVLLVRKSRYSRAGGHHSRAGGHQPSLSSWRSVLGPLSAIGCCNVGAGAAGRDCSPRYPTFFLADTG